jgi:hypothetical protein
MENRYFTHLHTIRLRKSSLSPHQMQREATRYATYHCVRPVLMFHNSLSLNLVHVGQTVTSLCGRQCTPPSGVAVLNSTENRDMSCHAQCRLLACDALKKGDHDERNAQVRTNKLQYHIPRDPPHKKKESGKRVASMLVGRILGPVCLLVRRTRNLVLNLDRAGQ